MYAHRTGIFDKYDKRTAETVAPVYTVILNVIGGQKYVDT